MTKTAPTTQPKIDELNRAGLTRELQADIRVDADGDGSVVEMAFASEEPYERWWGVEILDHSPGSMRLDRLNNGAQLQLDHSTSVKDTLGRVLSAEIGEDHKARAKIQLTAREDLKPIVDDIKSGILTKVSVGYRIHSMCLESEESGIRTYRVDDFEPYEISIVAVPADDTVGVGRAAIQPAEANTMTENATVVATDENAVAGETIKIMNLAEHVAKRAPDSDVMKIADDYISFGKTFEEFRAQAWAIFEKATAPKVADVKPITHLDMSHKEVRDYSLFKAIRASMSRNWKGAELELDVSREIASRLGKEARGFFVPYDVQRVLDTTTPTGAAELVGTDHMGGDFIDLLRTRSVVIGAGATTLQGLVGNVDIPKQEAASTFYWLSEGGDVTAQDPGTGVVAMSPKTVAGAVAMTRRLLLQSDPSVEGMVRNDLIVGAGLTIDLASVEGTGLNDQPTGVSNQSNVNAITLATAGAPTWAEAVAFETALDDADALSGSLAYVTTPTVIGHCKTTPKDAGSGLFLMDGMDMNGYPVRRRTGLTANQIVFGNWSDVIVGLWGVLDIKPDEAALAASGGLILRVFQDVDIAVRHAESFSVANLV